MWTGAGVGNPPAQGGLARPPRIREGRESAGSAQMGLAPGDRGPYGVEFDLRWLARVRNSLVLRAAARVGNAGSQYGRVRPPRVSEGRESAGVGSAYRRTKSFKNIPQMAPNENVGFHAKVKYAW